MALSVKGSLDLPWRVSLLALAPLLLLEVVLGLMVNRRLPAFERQLMSRIQAGATRDELLELVGRQKLLWFAAPRHSMLAQVALIYKTTGQFQQAAEAYRQAYEEAPASSAFPLGLGLGDSLFELGQLEQARQVYGEVLDDKHVSARACANLARIARATGGDLQEAETYLRQALELSSDDPRLRCELVELLAQQGRREDAAWELQLAAEQLADGSERDQALLAEARAAVDGIPD